MKILSLELHGFKSFADRTRLELHEGITAIVGPNGCGKSNISDAIRWVLGEQAPSAIRGSRMEEAIFGGTELRRPISRAEVELRLSNEDGTLAVPATEVEIGRTVYRGGEGEYRLNDRTCRLRDLQDLCRDTGLGATEYAIIEGRMIDAILSERAEERRALFEEAAEIGRYKDRRRTALRRLEQASEDLERLEDVLGEVGSKVRSLAQQRSRAERYRRYRGRLLRLEIAVARVRLEALDRQIREAERELEAVRRKGAGEEGELRRLETRVETLRLEIAEEEGERARRAAAVEEQRAAAEEHERQRLVSVERATSARARIEATARELDELARRGSELTEEEGRLEAELARERQRARELEGRREELEASEVGCREERDATRAEEASLLARVEELEGEIRLLEARREASAERIGERTAELERRQSEEEEARREGQAARGALEEARREGDRMAVQREKLEAELAEAREATERDRQELGDLRDRLGALEGRLSAERSRLESLAALVASGGDLPAAVRTLLGAEGAPRRGVRGVLADSLEVEAGQAARVEACLGPFLHGVVVDDWDAVRRIHRWASGAEGLEGDGLLLLPLDPGPSLPGPGGTEGGALLEAVRAAGPGAPWVRALLAGISASDGTSFEPRQGPWTAPDGSGQDRWGAVRLGRPAAGRGVLLRRAELDRTRERVQEEEARRTALEGERDRRVAALGEAEKRVAALEESLARVARGEREARARSEAASGRCDRAERRVEEIRARMEVLRASLEQARSRAAEEEERLAELRQEWERARAGLEEARQRSRGAEAAWEERKEELQELELRRARHGSALEVLEVRVRRIRRDREELEERRERLEAEREERKRELSEAEGEAARHAEAAAGRLERRATLEEGLREVEASLAERRERLEAAEAELRALRQAERGHAERRHALELELAELRGRRGNLHERIEGEWDEPLESLVGRVEPPDEGGPAEWAEELEAVRRKLIRLGPVNLLAEEEYEREHERQAFLESQRDDLLEAREDLREAIRRINRSAAETFRTTFGEVRVNFQRTFGTLFEGGECDLWLADPEDPLDSPIEISASPRGKRTQRIHLLSGGERALTALALLFAIYLAKPSPFCVMDEVDAPLDENNVLRFVGMLERFKADTQFVVITHNPRTIEAADWIYGVTMQEPGVSSVVGVELSDLPSDRIDPGELIASAGAG